MNRINELDEAQMRSEFRRLYKEIGPKGMCQVIYELAVSIQICCEVVKEEMDEKS